jgi:hypothetical protein
MGLMMAEGDHNEREGDLRGHEDPEADCMAIVVVLMGMP